MFSLVLAFRYTFTMKLLNSKGKLREPTLKHDVFVRTQAKAEGEGRVLKFVAISPTVFNNMYFNEREGETKKKINIWTNSQWRGQVTNFYKHILF